MRGWCRAGSVLLLIVGLWIVGRVASVGGEDAMWGSFFAFAAGLLAGSTLMIGAWTSDILTRRDLSIMVRPTACRCGCTRRSGNCVTRDDVEPPS